VKRIVLDASALMTLFDDRPGVEKVKEWIELADAKEIKLCMSVVNWGEVYYSIWHKYSRSSADEVAQEITRLPIEIVDANLEITKMAASLKAETRLPYADCFAVALSKLRGASLATADADFDKVCDQIVLLKLP
jgi:predicted nucleic acid-binding protein